MCRIIGKYINITKRQQNGSLTVETSISLVIFLFSFLSILYLCKFARTQVVLQHAINQVCMEISQYSYVTNFIPKEKFQDKKFKDYSESNKYFMINKYPEPNKYPAKYDNLSDSVFKECINGIFKIYKIIKSGDDIDDEGNVLVYLNELVEKNTIKYLNGKLIAEPMCKKLIVKYLDKNLDSADNYLKRLGVNNGINGLDFSRSNIFSKKNNIDIELSYSMDINFPFLPEKSLIFFINASSKSWGEGIDFNEIRGEDSEKENIWDYNWKVRTQKFVEILHKERNLMMVDEPNVIDFYDQTNNKCIYVHSLNTEMKSYLNNNEMNLTAVKQKFKNYAQDSIENALKLETIKVKDKIYDLNNTDKNVKLIMVVHKNALKNDAELKKLSDEVIFDISKEFTHSKFKIEIEIYYSDGIVNNDKN